MRGSIAGRIAAASERAGRLKSHWKLKLVMAFGLHAFALAPYYLLQTYPQFTVTVMPVTVLDEWVPFDDRLSGLYLSLFFLTAVVPVQMTRREQLGRYTAGVIAMSLCADVIFFLWPTTIVRPDPAAAASPLYANLTRLVSPHNAFPSLHAAMAVFSAFCYEQITPHVRALSFWRAGIWLWALGIIYATLAVKEHVAVDILAGIALGASAYVWTFRRSPGPSDDG